MDLFTDNYYQVKHASQGLFVFFRGGVIISLKNTEQIHENFVYFPSLPSEDVL